MTTSSGAGSRRVAIVTGGARGIGLGIARALAQEGWDLALCGIRHVDEVGAVVEELTSLGATVRYTQADISDPHARAAFAADAIGHFGHVNALVNNAGRGPRVRADLLDATEESFEELIRTNLQGPYFLTQTIARHLVDRRTADPEYPAFVVFISSVSADHASINRGEYCVSKAGLSMAAQLFALRLAPSRIPVYEIRPGIIDTDMTAKVRDVYDKRIADGLVPEGRWGQAADVGRAVAALLRGDFPYATGTVIRIDGGLSLPRL